MKVVRTYKHKTLLVPFDERCEIVGAIKYMDKVVPQTSMDKMEAYNIVHFDVLFHVSDWKDSDMYKLYREEIFLPLAWM